MADRDDHRGSGGDRWRRQDRSWDERRRDEWHGREGRSFGEAGRFNSDEARWGQGSRGEGEAWRRERYGSRFDQDRAGYGSGYDRERGGYGAGGRGYGGQEYGLESGRQDRPSRHSGGSERETWRAHGAAPYGDLEFNARADGVEEFGAPHDYAYHPPQGHEFDTDYLRWREEQLKAHDRDYQEWRRHQHQQYDEEYRKYRGERRDTFGKSFHEWRAQRNVSAGMPQQHVEPETGDYARRQAQGFGAGQDRPSGSLESPGALTNGPALSQAGGGGAGQQAAQAGSGGSEFGKAPDKVQQVTDDAAGRREDGEGGANEARQH